MPAVNAIQTNFSAGELSPFLFARVDLDKYANGCYALENFITQRYGGIRKRGGTEYINEVKDSTKSVRLVPFIYSVTQAYIIEFGDLYVRFYTNGGILESSPGVAVEVVTPYSQTDIWDLQFAQSADVLYIAHASHPPSTLSRTSATTFVLAEMVFEDGPFLDINTVATSLTPAEYGSVTPLMTSATTPSGTVTNSPSGDGYRAFNKANSGYSNPSGGASGYLAYDFAGSTTKVADAYWLKSATNTVTTNNAPKSWTFDGYDGTNWVVLDTRNNETEWSTGDPKFYEFNNETAYEAYRLNWNAVWPALAATPDDISITELAIHERGQTQTPFNLTASSVTGINGGQGFLATDVGRMIRLLASDGRWRYVRIAAWTSSTVVTVRLYGHALPDLNPIVNWAMGSWSDETGWPASVGFFNGRLCFARTNNQPQTVWMSKVDNFTDFGTSSPLVDSDAIDATISSESVNEIKWIAEGTQLFLGTTAAIRTMGPNTTTGAFGPTNLLQKRETNYGASDVQPVRIGNTVIYSGYYGRDVREIAYSFEQDGYTSQDLSILSNHIPTPGIKQAAFAQNPDGIVWLVMDDSTLAGMTYERDQNVIAFHRHILGGSYSGGAAQIESVATIPGTDRDETWLVVRRTIDGSAVRYVERLSLGLDASVGKEDATYLDSYLTYSGASATVITGLDHLEGEVVQVWGNGAYLGEYTVASGSVTLTSAVTKATIGLSYTSVMETLSPEMGSRGGTAQTTMGRVSEVFLRVYRSLGGRIGGADSSRLEAINFRTTGDLMDSSAPLFTGDKDVRIEMAWERGKRLRLEHSDPTPFNLLGMIYHLKVHG